MRRTVLAATLVAAAVAVGAPPARAADPVTWCGGAETAADRLPDAVPALSIHVVYAYASDGADRFAALASPIATDLAAIDAWWRAQDAGRTLRFDLADAPACEPAFGRLDISSVRLPHDGSWYAAVPQRFDRLRDDLNGVFADPDKKYLVYYDGPVEDPTLCGESPRDVPGGGPFAFSAIFLGSLCGDAVGGANRAALVVAHELLHNLGAVQPAGPPHACPDDDAHVCDSPADVMYPTVEFGGRLDAAQLDVGRDDYYGHAGAWSDVRDSPFLERLDGPDRSPPAPLAGLTATGGPTGGVHLAWARSADDASRVRYEVYRDGRLLQVQPETRLDDPAPAGATHTYRIRPVDDAGRLGGDATLRFTAGLGVVDASGALVRDTVPPGPLAGLTARRTKTTLVLAWRAARDRGGLRGYRVLRNGRPYRLVRTRSLAVPLRLAPAAWSVRAVDGAGNAGEPARAVVRRVSA